MNWRKLLLATMFLGVFSAVAWGAYQQGEKNSLQNHMENQYQRAFNEMAFQMDLLNDEIGSTLAMNGGRNLTPALTEVWRLTSMIHSDIGQLPLGLLPFNEMEQFLTKIGQFSYETAVRDLSSDPLTPEEYEKLETLYSQSQELQSELRAVQSRMLEENLNWLALEDLMLTAEEQNGVIDGFNSMDRAVKGYAAETFVQTDQQSAAERRNQLQHIKGNKISKQDALKVAEQFSGDSSVRNGEVTESLAGSSYPFYTVSWNDGEDHASMDILKNGGQPIFLIRSRNPGEASLSLNEASVQAEKFLEQKGYKQMSLEESYQNGNTASFTFVRSLEEGVFVLDDSIFLKVALDTGEVLGFNGIDYLAGNEDIQLPDPELSTDEAISLLHSKFDVQETRRTMIRNELDERVLCYEFTGLVADDTFRVYINALNGQEEKVEKL
ncbi:germination protein YpeB [Jeotgalibacillus sp. R-1-5s-1]|uniref:germination protein YpeB n=1 Tax=Jeotgalibacillus sp. R-1-5s-1 TaxID=2555897 RepID=UPI00106C34DF|nr:germination protein YpeB [Jeotgalibacillus sp. R-1-5s-1]TFE00427.1 germination protein YpeB [Jeotgalibacillus sp. R-1-5s-1]